MNLRSVQDEMKSSAMRTKMRNMVPDWRGSGMNKIQQGISIIKNEQHPANE